MKHPLIPALARLQRRILGLMQIGAASIIVYWIFKICGKIKIDRSAIRGIKPPFIVLGNHTSNFDPALVQYVLAPHPCYFLTSNFYFRLPVVGKILNIFRAIPKIQFYPDIRATRRVAEAISRGEVIGIFPEGRRSIDGKCCPIPDSMARLIKKFKVPVISVMTSGGYFIWPRWSPFWRSGSVETVAKQLFTKEDICNMDVREIYDVLCQALAYNDYDWNLIAWENYGHKRAAEHLHLVLHQCPRCLVERTIRSDGTRLYCRECGNAAVMDGYGFLRPADSESVIFPDPVTWHAWQRENMRGLLRDDHFTIEAKVKDLRVADKYYGKYRSCGYGKIVVNKDGMQFRGRVDGQMTELFFPGEMLPAISTEFKEDFEVCDQTNAWWFFLAEEQQTVRIETALSIMHEQR